ncbi:MAG TPA: pantetheine-phosphate adenylyltransferase [Clostridiales bacterium]|jgi:pantetheine-phosphate adenylyltransferase|nr:pantetheine-phosphate adenylyltransferase [Clostridiales bacterium]
MNVVFAGTFDPFTLGHFDVASRASATYDKVIIAIAKSDNKRCMFDLNQRKNIVIASTKSLKNVEIYTFDGLLTDFCNEHSCKVLIRGLRTVNDFEYERSLSLLYKDLDPEIESVFFINNPKYSHIHSSLIRQLIIQKADISTMVHQEAEKLIRSYTGE